MTIDDTKQSLYDAIMKAYKESIKRGIEANSIFINENMVEVPSTWIKDDVGCARELPPMICGLYAYFTKDELPDNYSFAILKGPEYQDRLEKFESIGMEPEELRKAADLYRSTKGYFEREEKE